MSRNDPKRAWWASFSDLLGEPAQRFDSLSLPAWAKAAQSLQHILIDPQRHELFRVARWTPAGAAFGYRWNGVSFHISKVEHPEPRRQLRSYDLPSTG